MGVEGDLGGRADCLRGGCGRGASRQVRSPRASYEATAPRGGGSERQGGSQPLRAIHHAVEGDYAAGAALPGPGEAKGSHLG